MNRPNTGSEPDPWRVPVIVAQIPDAWLADAPAQERQMYARFLERRLDQRDRFMEEAIRARAAHV